MTPEVISETIRTVAWAVTIVFVLFAGTVYSLCVLFTTGKHMLQSKEDKKPVQLHVVGEREAVR